MIAPRTFPLDVSTTGADCSLMFAPVMLSRCNQHAAVDRTLSRPAPYLALTREPARHAEPAYYVEGSSRGNARPRALRSGRPADPATLRRRVVDGDNVHLHRSRHALLDQRSVRL